MAANSTHTLRDRLLRDVAEIQTKPYPNIALKIEDHDITTACLVLTVEGYGYMHMTVHFPGDYPLNPPMIQMNSTIKHPNIFGSYICSSILNTTEGYTSAYTLKSIAIQLLSFFNSDSIEQTGGGYSIDLAQYKADNQRFVRDRHRCLKCSFGSPGFSPDSLKLPKRTTSVSFSPNPDSFNSPERAMSTASALSPLHTGPASAHDSASPHPHTLHQGRLRAIYLPAKAQFSVETPDDVVLDKMLKLGLRAKLPQR